MSLLTDILSDLQERRLVLPAIVLIVLAIAVPAVGSLTASPGSVTPPQPQPIDTTTPPGVPPPDAALAAINSRFESLQARYRGRELSPLRLPWSQFAALATGASGVTGATGAKGASGATGPTTSTPVKPTVKKPTVTKVPASGLKKNQSFRMTLAMTNTKGGIDTTDSVERLSVLTNSGCCAVSVLPSSQQPLLVYLGILSGGHSAVFLVQPGTVVSGPGVCVAGTTACEIVELQVDQVEDLSVTTSDTTALVAEFSVAAIKAINHSSVAAAKNARAQESPAGRALVKSSTSTVLPLFEYVHSAGVVVDLRNISVGG